MQLILAKNCADTGFQRQSQTIARAIDPTGKAHGAVSQLPATMGRLAAQRRSEVPQCGGTKRPPD